MPGKQHRFLRSYIVPAAKRAAMNSEIRRAIGPSISLDVPLVPAANPSGQVTHYGVELRGLNRAIVQILEVLRKPGGPPGGLAGTHGANAYQVLLGVAAAQQGLAKKPATPPGPNPPDPMNP